MTTGEWISTANMIFMVGSAVFLAVNRWVNSRASTETKLSRDLAESDKLQSIRDQYFDSELKRLCARVEQVHVKSSDALELVRAKSGERMDAIDRHLTATDSRLTAIETTLKFKALP